MSRFIDTHCHFDFPVFYHDLENSLVLAQQAQVKKIIIPAVAQWNWDAVTELSRYNNALYCALGLHPLYIEAHTEQHLIELKTRLKTTPRCVAMGEMGLDNYMTNPHPEKQQQFLIAQLKLAIEFDLPVILHSRKTHDNLSAILRRYSVPRKGVIHGFRQSATSRTFCSTRLFHWGRGHYHLSTCTKTRRAIASLPLERLLLETDAPDMPVSGFQGEPNRPERILAVFLLFVNCVKSQQRLLQTNFT